MPKKPTQEAPDLSIAEWAVLGLIAEHQTHGFAVAREFEPDGLVGRVWTLPRPLVYRAINTLKEQGLVKTAGSMPGSSGPQRTLLKISPAGRRAIEHWLQQPIEHIRDARSHLIVKLLLVDRAGQDPSELVRRQRENLVPIIVGLKQQMDSSEGFELVIVAWRLYAAEALDMFLKQLPDLRSPT